MAMRRRKGWTWEERDTGYETPCWIWLGSVHSHRTQGYGRYGGWRAHCMFYRLFIGPVPAGLQLDHKCKVRRCVNPEHLEPVTTAENTRRGRQVKLTMGDAHQIRDLAKCGLFEIKEIGQLYGVARTTASAIVHDKRWRE